MVLPRNELDDRITGPTRADDNMSLDIYTDSDA